MPKQNLSAYWHSLIKQVAKDTVRSPARVSLNAQVRQVRELERQGRGDRGGRVPLGQDKVIRAGLKLEQGKPLTDQEATLLTKKLTGRNAPPQANRLLAKIPKQRVTNRRLGKLSAIAKLTVTYDLPALHKDGSKVAEQDHGGKDPSIYGETISIPIQVPPITVGTKAIDLEARAWTIAINKGEDRIRDKIKEAHGDSPDDTNADSWGSAIFSVEEGSLEIISSTFTPA